MVESAPSNSHAPGYRCDIKNRGASRMGDSRGTQWGRERVVHKQVAAGLHQQEDAVVAVEHAAAHLAEQLGIKSERLLVVGVQLHAHNFQQVGSDFQHSLDTGGGAQPALRKVGDQAGAERVELGGGGKVARVPIHNSLDEWREVVQHHGFPARAVVPGAGAYEPDVLVGDGGFLVGVEALHPDFEHVLGQRQVLRTEHLHKLHEDAGAGEALLEAATATKRADLADELAADEH
ncbi:aldo/keto reductase [Babesia caballi]|uniref:Aldo/keto reductase n=1 Tax=Babesia caballi TaxID=5871 RepID=A0AAV4LR29_BABCB|nr:aldo/keto reductase [Babesia caballi]